MADDNLVLDLLRVQQTVSTLTNHRNETGNDLQ